MKKISLLLLVLAVYGIQPELMAQDFQYYLNNKLRFVDGNNDTIPYPFIGGFVAPQFSEIDMNNDGVKDLFVFDRSGNRKLTFLNQGVNGQTSYVYAPQYEYQFPELKHWVLLRDYNCDGKPDIFTSAVSAGYGFTVYKNMSQGDSLQFVHVASDLLDRDGNNMYCAAFDIPVIDDVDGDGDLDLMAFGTLGGYVEYYRNDRVEEGYSCDSLTFSFVDFCWGSFAEGGLTNDIILGDNCFGLKFYKNALHTGSTILTFDADEDGDKEMLIGDVDYPDFKFVINGKVEKSWPYDTAISFTTGYPSNTRGVYIDKFPAAFYLDINNDGKKDLIAASNDYTSASNLHQVWWYENKGKNNNPDFEFRDSSFLQDKTIDFGSQTVPALFDYDGDGDDDLLLSHRGNWRDTKNSNDRFALYENIGGNKAIFKFVTNDWLGFSDDSITAMYPTFVDLDSDGLKDLVTGGLNGKLRYYRNTGTQTGPQFTLVTDSLGSIDVGTTSAPHFYDFNHDNAPDLLVGDLSGHLSLFYNKGTSSSPYFFPTADVEKFGKVNVSDYFYKITDWDTSWNPSDSVITFEYEGNAAPWVEDLDMDGKPELVCGSKGGKLLVYAIDTANLGDSFMTYTEYFVKPNGSGDVPDLGGRTAPVMMDMDDDGRPDILLGNSRGGIHYLNSTYTEPDTFNSVGPELLPVELSLYPNPAYDYFVVRTEKPIDGMSHIEVFDVYGKKVLETTAVLEGDLRISVSSLAAGNYFVRVNAPGYRSSSLIITKLR